MAFPYQDPFHLDPERTGVLKTGFPKRRISEILISGVSILKQRFETAQESFHTGGENGASNPRGSDSR